MRESILIGFHLITCLQFTFCLYSDFHIVVPRHVMKIFSNFGGKLQFLTTWNMILQTIFFIICLINDFYGTNAINPKKPPFIRKFKDYVFATLVFPIAMFVAIVFWSLMFIDRELILPKALDPYFPWWLNHILHTMIIVSTFMELLLTSRKYPKRSHGVFGIMTFTFIYLIWILILYYINSIWVYPILKVLTPPLRLVFFGISMLFSLLLYFVGELLNKLVWGTNEKMKQHKSHSK